jgi:Tfp pilus assembly protein PilN
MKNPFLKAEQHNASFLPQEYVERKNEMRANILCLALFGVVMFGVVTAFFVTNRQWLQVKAQHSAMNAQYTQESARIEQYKRLEEQKAEMMDKAEITTMLVEKVPRSKLLSEIVTRMPKDITLLEVQLIGKRMKEAPPPTGAAKTAPGTGQIQTLSTRTSVSTAKDGAPPPPPKPLRIMPPRFEFSVKLTGVARVNTDVSDYLQSLNACTILENVDLKYIKEATIEKVELRKFEIEASIRRDADARGLDNADLRQASGVVGADPKRSAATGSGSTNNKVSVTTVPEKED